MAAETSGPVISIRKLTKTFGAFVALSGVSLDISPSRGRLHHRTVRLRQEHAFALHQLP